MAEEFQSQAAEPEAADLETSEQYDESAFEPESFEPENFQSETSESEDQASALLETQVDGIDDELEEPVMVLEEIDVALVLPVWEPTGDLQVDAALEVLATLDDLSIHDHAEVLASVHSSLHQRLTDISA